MGKLAASQLVVDTDIVIDHLRQRTTILRDAALNYECSLTAITLYELRAVSRLSQNQREILDQLRTVVEILPFDQDAAEKAASIWRSLADVGQLIGLPDILIAGSCLANDLPLLTRNIDHFNRIPELKLISPDELPSAINTP